MAHTQSNGQRPEPAIPPDPPSSPAPAKSLRSNLFRGSRITRAHLLAAVLLGLLGFSLVVQARQTQSGALDPLNQSQLVQLLDNVSQQADRLDIEARELQDTQRQLQTGSDRTAAAERAARSRLQVLGVLAGTIPATGPGIELTISDPGRQVSAAMLLDVVQELRDAGAEAIQLGPVRVVASTSLVDAGAGRIQVDGRLLIPPYPLLAIGDPQTMSAALDIPGGVHEVLRQVGANSTVSSADRLTVSAVHQVTTPRYAVPRPS